MHLGLALRVLSVIQMVWVGTATATKFGVIYGGRAAQAAGGAENAVRLWRAQGIQKVRLEDSDSGMLRALGGSSIEVIVGLRDDELVDVGVSKTSAHSWVSRNVEAYLPDTRIAAIAMGNEILSHEDQSLVPFLVPAMRNIHDALSAAGLHHSIKVSTPQSLRLLSNLSPPSAASFDSSLCRALSPLLDFLSSTGSFFMLNLHPSDVQQANPSDLSLGHALFSIASGVDDLVTGLHYTNKFEALLDAVFVAMASLNHPELDIVVTQVSWYRDSSNDDDAGGATFRSDLLKHLASGNGTPFKPRKGSVDTYVEEKIQSSMIEASSESDFVVDGVSSLAVDAGVRRKLLADKTWCVAKDGQKTEELQYALDWACGPGGANCQPIQAGQFCFLPNTMQAHASYAFNSYYQKVSWAAGSCDFGGLAEITSKDPSYTGCLYPSSGSDPSNSTNNTGGAQTLRHQLSLASLALILVVTWRLSLVAV